MRLIGLAIVLALPLLFAARIAEAQATQASIPRIGVLSGTRADSDLCLQKLRQGLKQLEYVEGKTHVLELRRSEGRHELIPRLAGELGGLNVNLIVSLFSEAHPSVKQATSTIPVVMAASTYPVEHGDIRVLEVTGRDGLDAAFATMSKDRVGAVTALPLPLLTGERRRIAELALRNRLPSVFHWREYVEVGGLMSYGAGQDDLIRRAATYVDKILKGAKPADLPVEQPTKFEFVISLKTAKALGLTIPPSELMRADRVIE